MTITHGSLFSGIGGFDLAAQANGWNNIFHCEVDPFCKRVLEYYWPEAESIGDIKTADFSKYEGKITVISGGFPCQPYSLAGKRLGKNDERHLWPYMLEAIRTIKPTYVVGENVFGLTSWNDGLVLEEVCVDLETEGYKVQPFIIPAAGAGAPHKRDRVFILAYNNQSIPRDIDTESFSEYVANSNQQGLQGWPNTGSTREIGQTVNEQFSGLFQSTWEKFPTQDPVRIGDDGLSGRLVDIALPSWQKQSIQSLGNAVVPQIPHKIFQIITYLHENSV
jgi:DNA (cytosine-5)-methyltransferase 1